MNRFRQTLAALFAERQIYIRKSGSVTFVSLSRRSTIMLGIVFFAMSAWVGFASVHVVFNDGLGTERERQVKEMQLAYEADLNRLRLAHDDLNAQLVLTRDWFRQTTDKLEKRHNDLTLVFEQHTAINTELQDMQASFASVAKRNLRDKNKTELIARTVSNYSDSLESRTMASQSGGKTVQLAENNAAHNSVIEGVSIMPHLSNDVFGRVQSLDVRQKDLLNALEESVDQRIAEYESVIAGTEILEPESFMAQVLPEGARAIGGPYIPLENEKPGINSDLHQQLYRISTNLERLQNLSASMAKIPLALPIHDFRLTSGFGARLDPFKKRAAFHAGIDFGTATGTPIYTTLPGIVTRAGHKGPYGLVVEIDHGDGFRTRYGHLARSRVRRGQRVEFQQHIADAGNSGRSTGPHLHYEIWYEGKVRNPAAFLDVGKQIFNIAETLSHPAAE